MDETAQDFMGVPRQNKSTFEMNHIRGVRVTSYMDDIQLQRSLAKLCLAKIEGAFEINNIQRDRATYYMYEIQPSRSFGDGQARI